MKTEHVLYSIALALLVVAIFMKLGSKYQISDIKPKIKKIATEIDFSKTPDIETKIDYNFPIALSGKTKNEIYQIRKEYVEKSIFANENYEPSEAVFGPISANKPWISLNVCKENENDASKTDGPSEEARFLINPSVLVALEYPFLFTYDNEEWCSDTANAMLPKEVNYNSTKNEITVVYSKLPFYTRGQDFYQFNGLNARDFGYNYAYIDIIKSRNLPQFTNSNNIARNTIQFLNYIHTGGSCKVEGGCNNGSPRQDYLEFDYPEKKYVNNCTIYIKLWKDKPLSHWLKADITEKIIIEDY